MARAKPSLRHAMRCGRGTALERGGMCSFVVNSSGFISIWEWADLFGMIVH
jgi:hypothetical protein